MTKPDYIMRIYFLTIIILFCFSFLKGQNLVLNPSFEEYSQIPDEYSDINERYYNSNVFFAKYWRKIVRTSPDYYHKTSNFFASGIPINNMGNHPSIEGDAYIGFIPVFYNGVLEPITGEFTQPLVQGEIYNVRFSYRFAGKSAHSCLNRLEAYISNDYPFPRSLNYMNEFKSYITPEISNNVSFSSNLVNDGEWHELDGVYKAKGGEKYISLGVFYQGKYLYNLIDEYQAGNIYKADTTTFLRFFKKYAKHSVLQPNPGYVPDLIYIYSKTNEDGTSTEYSTKLNLKVTYYFIDQVYVGSASE